MLLDLVFILSTYKSCSWESFSILPWHFPPSFIRLTDFLILGHELKSFLFVGILQSGQKRKRLLVQELGQGLWQACLEKLVPLLSQGEQGGIGLRSGGWADSWGLVHTGNGLLVTVPISGSPAGQ